MWFRYFFIKINFTGLQPPGKAEHNRVSEPASVKGVALQVPFPAPKQQKSDSLGFLLFYVWIIELETAIYH